jgi:hypothetical protein
MKLRAGTILGLVLSTALFVGCSDDDDPIAPPPPAPQPPATPAGLAVSAVGPSQVRVTFTAVTGATGYVVERAGATGNFASIATPTSASYDDSSVAPGTTYRYRVAATNAAGTSAFSGEATVTTPQAGPREATITADITADRTLYADTVYQLSGFIKVRPPATLTIQPGTKIVGDFDIPGSSLFILRGAKIDAQGTAEAPIVFTSERPFGQRQPGDWGGVIIIGNGITNRGAPTFIEGTGTDPVLNPLQDYSGGNDNNDDSGTLRYVRIEFAGFPTAPNEELNSLTMAAVGRGTTIEYVQILLGLDDSFEWFGGAVDGRYLISYEAADDHFDASEGFVGRVQYGIAFQSIRPEPRPNLAGGAASDPQGMENDGCWASNCLGGNNNTNAEPFTVPVFANMTLIGAPVGAWETPGGNYGMMLRRGTGGLYVNSVIARYSKAGISFRGQNTFGRSQEGNFGIRNVLIAQTPSAFQAEDLTNANIENRQFTLDFAANDIEVSALTVADLFTAIPLNTQNADADDFDWTPAAGSPLATGGLDDFSGLPSALRNAAGDFVTPTAFRGAAAPGGVKWWEGWTNYARF